MPDAVSTLEDEALAQRAACREGSAGDTFAAVSSYERLYRRHARAVLAFLAARTQKSDRDDLLQKVWTKVWEKLPNQFSGGSFRAWLFQIARTRVIDHLRLRRTDPMGATGSDIASRIGKPGDHVLDMERLQIVQDCLVELDEREAGLIRGLLGGESYADIGSRLQIDSNAARKATHGAKAKLRGAATAMTLLVLDVPDDPQRLPRWLEDHLVGMELAGVVAELAAVHQGGGADSLSLDELLEAQRAAVLQVGVSTLNDSQIRLLLRNPRLLLELQELVLTEGGGYWAELLASAGTDAGAIQTVWSRIQSSIGPPEPAATDPQKMTANPWYRRPWVVSLATAALVLLAVQLVNQSKTPVEGPGPGAHVNAGWGWDMPGALPQDVPADLYLNSLADAAGAWFDRRPESAAELARRINQFRQGCTTLLLAEHKPLSEEDRAWFDEKCREWAEELDDHLAAVEAGEDVLTVRAATDETINKVISTLRERAAEAA